MQNLRKWFDLLSIHWFRQAANKVQNAILIDNVQKGKAIVEEERSKSSNAKNFCWNKSFKKQRRAVCGFLRKSERTKLSTIPNSRINTHCTTHKELEEILLRRQGTACCNSSL